MFDSWSIEALQGYIVMLDEFLSANILEELRRETYVGRLASARLELKLRIDENSGKKTSLAFPLEETTRGEPDATS